MKRSIRYLAAGGLVLLCLLAHRVSAKTDSLAITPTIHRIFPFEVGQQYEFKSSGWFFRPNGDSLPPNTVATVTITDTVINGKTYLRIPYWSPFGSEFYRMDDSLRIWESCTFDTSRDWWVASCANPTDYGAQLIYWSYQTAYSRDFITDRGPRSMVWHAVGWSVTNEDTSLELTVLFREGGRAVSARFGGAAVGLAQHWSTDGEGNEHLWGVFRPVSTDSWPLLDDVVTVEAGKPQPTSLDMALRPNPFNPSTTVTYSIASGGYVRIAVFNLAGQRVRELENRYRSSGRYVVVWDGRDDMGRQVASGVYLARLTAKEGTVTKRMVLAR